MSILIKGMEMPTRCEDCFCYRHNAEYDYAYCNISSVNVLGNANARLNNCPLVPVPQHGRLIDADTLCNRLEKAGKIKPYLEGALNVAISFALTAPTIIPTEENNNDR